MTALLAFFATTIGKYIGLAIAALTAFGTAWLAARRAGAKAERAKQAERDAASTAAAKAVDDKIAASTAEDRRKELAKWQKR